MAMPSVQESAAKYAARGGAAGQLWQEGAARYQGDPTALAAQAGQKAQAAYVSAWTTGRIQRGLANAGRTGWLAGVNRPESASAYSGGVTGKGAAKWASKMTNWWPVFAQLQSQIQGMPNTTAQDAKNRVGVWIDGTMAAKQNL